MFEKKKLVLNCDVCDTRSMREEDYSSYENIVLNADILLVNDTSKGIINRLPMITNIDNVMELEEGQEIHTKSVNGSYEISGTSGVQGNTILSVNGSVTIAPGTEEILKKYIQITVNGKVLYPKSLEGCLGKMSINGEAVAYPDGCTLLKSSFELDRYFPLRAREEGQYFAASKIVIKDKSVDLKKLAEKRNRFVTPTLIVYECMVEECAPLFDETVNFVVVPDDFEILLEDVELNDSLVEQYGTKLFVYGDVTITDDGNKTCEKLEKLVVKGNVNLKQCHVDLLKRIHAQYDGLNIQKGRLFENCISVTLDQSIFDHSPEGIQIRNAAKVKVAKEVSAETILEKLQTWNCALIFCEKEQKSAMEAVSKDAALIRTSEENKDMEENGSGFFGQLKDTKVINADKYVM